MPGRQAGSSVIAFEARLGFGEEKGGGVVVPLEHQAAAEDFVAPGIGGVPELLEDLEMGFFDADGSAGPGAVVQQEHVAEPGAHPGAEGLFAESGPEVEGAAHGLLGAVVEVVAEGWADLGLGFEGRDELALHDDQEVPLLGGAEVAGEFEGFVVEDVAAINARLDDEPGQEADEAVHLRAARDSGTQALVFRARASLFFELFGAGLPVEAHSFAHVAGQV